MIVRLTRGVAVDRGVVRDVAAAGLAVVVFEALVILDAVLPTLAVPDPVREVGNLVLGPRRVPIHAEVGSGRPARVVKPRSLPAVLASRAALPARAGVGVGLLAAVVDRRDKACAAARLRKLTRRNPSPSRTG